MGSPWPVSGWLWGAQRRQSFSLSILLVALVTWLVLRTSTKLLHLLGPRGLDRHDSNMALLLVCIGVQFVAMGIRNFVSE